MKIADIELALIDRIKTHFDRRLKVVESIPMDLSPDEFNRMAINAPGVFISFAFGPRLEVGNQAAINGRWVFTAVTSHANGELFRRHGSGMDIGAYEIMERLIPLLHFFDVQDVGTLEFIDSRNLFREEYDVQGVSAYSAVFNLPMVFDASLLELSGLDNFRIFDSQIDLAPIDHQIEAHDTVQLEQAT